MLINGLTVEGKENVVVGNGFAFCHACAAKLAKKETYNKAKEKIKKEDLGKVLVYLPGLQDKDGEKVYLCHECLAEFAERTAEEKPEQKEAEK